VRHRSALISAVLAVVTAVLVLPSPASAALAGFQLRLSAPATLKAGANAKTVEAVVSTDTVRRCQKVRWSMVLRVADGLTFDDLKVTRIEDNQEFPLNSQINGDTARLTDVQFDPGQLCRGSTVTSRYDISIDDGAPSGRLGYEVQAVNADNEVFSQASATSQVDGTAPASPTPTETATTAPTPTESDDAADTGADADDATDAPSEAAAAAVPTDGVSANSASAQGGVPSLLGPGLIVGALFVFIGVGILLRLRTRNKAPKAQPAPTSFYPTYRTR